MEWPKPYATKDRAEFMDALVAWMRDNGVARLEFPEGLRPEGHDRRLAAFEIEILPPNVTPIPHEYSVKLGMLPEDG
jgi:hypothetical protein